MLDMLAIKVQEDCIAMALSSVLLFLIKLAGNTFSQEQEIKEKVVYLQPHMEQSHGYNKIFRSLRRRLQSDGRNWQQWTLELKDIYQEGFVTTASTFRLLLNELWGDTKFLIRAYFYVNKQNGGIKQGPYAWEGLNNYDEESSILAGPEKWEWRKQLLEYLNKICPEYSNTATAATIQQPFIHKLPFEILGEIIKYLEPDDLVSIGSISLFRACLTSTEEYHKLVKKRAWQNLYNAILRSGIGLREQEINSILTSLNSLVTDINVSLEFYKWPEVKYTTSRII